MNTFVTGKEIVPSLPMAVQIRASEWRRRGNVSSPKSIYEDFAVKSLLN